MQTHAPPPAPNPTLQKKQEREEKGRHIKQAKGHIAAPDQTRPSQPLQSFTPPTQPTHSSDAPSSVAACHLGCSVPPREWGTPTNAGWCAVCVSEEAHRPPHTNKQHSLTTSQTHTTVTKAQQTTTHAPSPWCVPDSGPTHGHQQRQR